ncbi:MAG: hypothetical protein WA905_15625, partial [Pseudolabrys sp.]
DVSGSNVRFGSKADMTACPRNVRSYPESDILCGERNGTERDFSHPISHRTPQYRVGNHGIGRFVITQKCWIFRIKRNCTT